MSKQELSFGIVGNASSGKDFVANMFVERGFVHVSGSDILRETIRSRGLEPTRELQTLIANEVRGTYDEAFFVRESMCRARERSGEAGKIVISGIYAPVEVEFARRMGARIVGVVRPGEKDSLVNRYRALLLRSDGTRDIMTFEEFGEAYKRENGGQAKSEANVNALLASVDFTIVNDGISAQTVGEQIDELIEG